MKETFEYYLKSMDINQTLANADPKSAQAQLNLVGSFNKLGRAFEKTQEYTEAIKWYEKGLSVAKRFERSEGIDKEVGVLNKQILECKAKLNKKDK